MYIEHRDIYVSLQELRGVFLLSEMFIPFLLGK